MAGFEVILYGRFWLITEVVVYTFVFIVTRPSEKT